jgi:antitoxin CptB
MHETAEARLKRMKMRSWRRGTKEMDLILGPWADAHLAGLSAPELEEYELLLAENDQDLMAWILGSSTPPADFAALLARITTYARDRLAGK